jgi:DNA-binding PadR family transcriptional regulator
MSKRPQTELAVLGVLSVEPMSGYAVRRAITGSMGLFWSESFGQIYPTLARLLEDGLVAPAGHGRTSGSSYAITEVGRRRLRELLTQPVPSTPPRNGRLLRLFFGALVGAQTCAEVVEEARTSQRTPWPAWRRSAPTSSRSPTRVRPTAASSSAPVSTPLARNGPGPRSPSPSCAGSRRPSRSPGPEQSRAVHTPSA